MFNLDHYACHVDELKNVENGHMEMIIGERIIELDSKRVGNVQVADLTIMQC